MMWGCVGVILGSNGVKIDYVGYLFCVCEIVVCDYFGIFVDVCVVFEGYVLGLNCYVV